jgi:type IV secretion system protein VirB4
VVIRANLAGLEDDIAIISAREQTLLLLDQIRAEVGDDPAKWLPLFHTRRKEVIS